MPRSEATAAYLRRVGLDADAPLPPTYDTLLALHRAHLDAVPYENLEIMLGRPPSVDPGASLARVGSVGRAGYCFHQNGALGTVLAELGFEMSRRHGHVWTDGAARDDTSLNHLVLVADGLPTDANPGGRWWVDVGLGDAFRDPLPVVVGHQEQAGFDYAITEVREDGWSFRHDRARHVLRASRSRPGPWTSRRSTPRTRRCRPPRTAVSRRSWWCSAATTTGIDTVRGCLWLRIRAEGRTETDLATYDAWRAALVDGTRLSLEGVDEAELRALYAALWAAHEAWTAAGRP